MDEKDLGKMERCYMCYHSLEQNEGHKISVEVMEDIPEKFDTIICVECYKELRSFQDE